MHASSVKTASATPITDEFMQQMMTQTRQYSILLLREGPNWSRPDRDKIIWEHGRRNFQLRADRILSIVCPVADGGNLKGVGIFNGSVEETKRIMDDDPGVKVGIFTYEVHPCRSFPGDSLPGAKPVNETK